MTAISWPGTGLAAEIRDDVTAAAHALSERGRVPRLSIVVATDDESSAWYVRMICRAAGRAGVASDVVDLGPGANAGQIRAALEGLSADAAVHGVMLQTPLPGGISLPSLAGAISPAKDVDGASPESLGRLAAGLPAFAPATAEAVLCLLDHYKAEISGRHAVIVGRSAVVGKPAAHLLLARDATVTVCHSRTSDLTSHTRAADILIVAAGRAGMITGPQIRPGATVVDVGTNPTADGGLTGDVDAQTAASAAGALTPVPGGVGPVTTAVLLRHAVNAAEAAAAG